MKFARAPLGVAVSAFVTSIVLIQSSGVARAADPPANVPVHVDANDEKLEILDRTALTTMVPVRVGRYGTALQRANVFAPLCASAPCDGTVAPGRHVFAVAHPGGGHRSRRGGGDREWPVERAC